MDLVPYSFNGTQINDGTNYRAWVERGSMPGAPAAEARYLKRPGAWPVYTGKDYQSTVYTIKIACLGDMAEQFETLNRLFYTGDQDTHLFIVTDAADSSKQYGVYATPTGQPTFGNDGENYTIRMAFDDPIWEAQSLSSSTWNITTSATDTTVTPAGNMDSYPVFEITPTQFPSTDYRYMLFVQVLPASTSPWPNRPIDLLGATDNIGLDTANLVSTGQMQADGDDLRVFVDGIEVDRWLSNMNSTDTHVWITADLPPAREMTLSASIGSTDNALSVENTRANFQAVRDCPAEGWLVLDSAYASSDSEEVHYSALNITDAAIGFTLDARGLRDTTAIAHALGANVRFMPHDIRLVWGKGDAAAPVTDDTLKPVFFIGNPSTDATEPVPSRNNSFNYHGGFADITAGGIASWRSTVKMLGGEWTRSGIFTTTDLLSATDTGDLSREISPAYPATVMGAKIGSYRQAGAWRYDQGSIMWNGHFPDGINSISGHVYVTKYSTDTGNDLDTVALFVSDGLDKQSRLLSGLQEVWDFWDFYDPVTMPKGRWGDMAINSSDVSTIPAGMVDLSFITRGTSGPLATDWTGSAIDKLYVGITNPPRVRWWNNVVNPVKLDITLDNQTANEGMRIIVTMLENETLIVDCAPPAPTARLNGQNISGAVQLDSVRDHWMRLTNAANTLSYTCHLNAPLNVTIVTKWYDRAVYL